MRPRLGETLIDRSRIATRVAELGQELADELRAELLREGVDLDATGRVVLMPVLTGALVFFSDLIRHMPVQMSLELVSVTSYPGASTESKGARLRSALPPDLAGKHVVVVDDILDTGQTLDLLHDLILQQRPASLRTCVLLRKDIARAAHPRIHHVGFDIPNAFVVGYGLDYDGHYRNLPDIRILASV